MMSVGLLRAIPWATIEDCVLGSFNTGGDGTITQCIWEAGFAMTAPNPAWHPRGLTMFDPVPPGLSPDDDILPKVAGVVANYLQALAGVCQGLCRVSHEHGAHVVAPVSHLTVHRAYANGMRVGNWHVNLYLRLLVTRLKGRCW
jgi:hypothetical protein